MPRASDGSSSRRARTASVPAGAYVRISHSETEQMIQLAESSRHDRPRPCHLVCHDQPPRAPRGTLSRVDMSAARSYAAVIVDDRRAHRPPDTPPPDRPAGPTTAGAGAPDSGEPAAGESIDLSSLSIAGFTRRRVGWACAALVAAWIVVIFARQAGDGAAAAARADQIARDNAALANEVAA